MKLNEFYKVLNELAPKALSDEYCERYGAYDNSGILVDTGKEINKVLFSLDLSLSAVQKAVEQGVNLIVTHHPALYAKINSVSVNDFQPLGEKLITCIQNGISVVSMHLNLDCAIGGIDESLQLGVCKSSGAGKGVASVMHPLSLGGYGRAYDIQKITLSQLVENIKKEFSTNKIIVYGDENKVVDKVASFCGSGADESAIEFAYRQGAQAVISSDFKHHILTLALEKGLSVIALTHYASENYGFEKYYEKIRQSVPVSCAYHTDEQYI